MATIGRPETTASAPLNRRLKASSELMSFRGATTSSGRGAMSIIVPSRSRNRASVLKSSSGGIIDILIWGPAGKRAPPARLGKTLAPGLGSKRLPAGGRPLLSARRYYKDDCACNATTRAGCLKLPKHAIDAESQVVNGRPRLQERQSPQAIAAERSNEAQGGLRQRAGGFLMETTTGGTTR